MRQSQYLDGATVKKSAFLGDSLYSNAFGAFRVTKVIKTKPFALEIEVTSDRWLGIGPCKDVSVLAWGVYGAYAGKLLASAVVETSTFAGCVGSGRLTFPPDFDPDDKNSWIVFQVLGGTNPDALAESDLWKGQYQSQPEFFGQKSIKELEESGKIQTKKVDSSGFASIIPDGEDVENAFAGFNSTVKNLTRFLVVGAVIYLVWPHRQTITSKIKSLSK